ncbi:hypothetical protein [Botrimarina sp.]|uniref:hypothetical protein n=1 Tax=Botrimarina sp. TaxID=2795802 RepID=UPI0032EC13AB
MTKLNEASPFRGFMINGEFVLFERSSPDALGARFLVLPCSEIATLKYTDPLKQSAFEAAGFRGTLSQ